MRYWQTPLGQHYDDVAQRYLAYVLSSVLIGLLTYVAMYLLGISQFPGYYRYNFLYHHRYALETALNFGFWLYLVEEWISRIWYPKAENHRRTVGVTCALWSGGFIIALILQITIIYERTDLYAPKIMHYFDMYPLRRPSLPLRLLIFSAMWLIALHGRIFLGILLQWTADLRRRAAGDNLHLSLEKGSISHSSSSAAESLLDTSSDTKPICITHGDAVSVVKPNRLAYITSEGHYCRFILKSEDTKNEIFTRVALRDVMAELPSEDFIQIHRSHVINKHYIEGVKKSGRSYALCMDGSNTPLPISRYRLPAVRERLELSALLDSLGH